MEQAMTGVDYPDMRVEIVDAIRALSDPEYQRRVWVRREMPHPNYHDNFTMNIHVLYDDTTVFENLSEAVGPYLRNQAEIRALAPLKDALDSLFDVYGTELTDEEYIDKPEWPTVIATARAALRVLTAH
ncbi:SCO4402 family protein [Actinosynnema sp. NPDC004786]